MQNEPRLTNSALLFLFADRLMPLDKAMTMGVEVPCRGVKVQSKPLAAEMFAAAFHALRELGLISLEVFTKKVLLIKTTRVRATLVRREPRPGLEGAAINILEGESTVKDVIRAWYRFDVVDPWSNVTDAAVEEALEAGLMRRVEADRGALATFIMGKTKVEPHCEQIAPLEGHFNSWLVKWEEFKLAEAQLYQELLEECSKAIQSRRESEDSD